MTKANVSKANSSDWIALIAQMLPLIIQMILEILKNQKPTPAEAKKLRASLKALQKLA